MPTAVPLHEVLLEAVPVTVTASLAVKLLPPPSIVTEATAPVEVSLVTTYPVAPAPLPSSAVIVHGSPLNLFKSGISATQY